MATGMNLVKVGKIVTKICEILHWLAAGIALASAVCCIVGPVHVAPIADAGSSSHIGLLGALLQGQLSYGLHVSFAQLNATTASVIFLFAAISAAIMAFVFHVASSCLKSVGKATPFHLDIQHKISEIGGLMMGLFALALVGQFAISATANATGCTVSTNVTIEMAVLGILVLCLSLVFKRGIELESEVEGLI